MLKADAVQPQILLLHRMRDSWHFIREQGSQISLFAANHQPHIAGMNYRVHFDAAKRRRVQTNVNF